MQNKKTLNIISESFPFGTGEQFFEAEVIELSSHFDEIILFPLSQIGESRIIPANVKVNLALAATNKSISRWQKIKSLPLVFQILFHEARKSKKFSVIFKKRRTLISAIIQARHDAATFCQSVDFESFNDNFFYSFWMNSGALLLAILKKQNKIEAFNFRVNGYDIYNERHEDNYLNFRYFNYQQVNQVFVLSTPAVSYLKALNLYPAKIRLNHYGIYDKGINPFSQSEEIQLVSCSNLIPLKRIDRLIDGLKHLSHKKVVWTHFGDGPLMGELKKKAEELSDNIQVDFRGNVNNELIIDMYRTTTIHAFLHTSETEGFGMAILEAQSFGIPAIVIGVGGVVDIVSNQTGIVLSPKAEGKEIGEALKTLLGGALNTAPSRELIKTLILEKFDAQAKYRELAEKIKN